MRLLVISYFFLCCILKVDFVLYMQQLIARTEVDTQVLAYSEGAIVPCTIAADMTLAQATIELVKVCRTFHTLLHGSVSCENRP